MRKIVAFLVLLLAAGCCSFEGRERAPGRTDAAFDLERKTIALLDEDGDVKCSGVWISERDFVTANHCVADDEIGTKEFYVVRGDVSAPDEDEAEAVRFAKLVGRSLTHDLAVVRAKLPPAHGIARLLPRDPIQGETVQAMGHPMQLVWSYTVGTVAAVRKYSTGRDLMWWVQSTAPVGPGSSGGGLFSVDGELMGVCSTMNTEVQNANLYVHVDYIRELLASVAKAGT